MTIEARKIAKPITIGAAQVHLKNLRVRDDITIDEVHLDGGDLLFAQGDAPGDAFTIEAAETRIDAMMSESNINTLLSANLPTDGLVRNVRLALLSGKARITGQFAKSVVHLPFTVEVVPLIENGVRIKLDIQSARSGFAIPAALLDVLEQWINNNRAIPLDLSRLPVPVKLDEIRCEPGRLIVRGRSRLVWPPAAEVVTLAPFTAGGFPTEPIEATASRLLPDPESPPALPGH